MTTTRGASLGNISLAGAIAGLIATDIALRHGVVAGASWQVIRQAFEAATIGGFADWFAVSALFHEVPLPVDSPPHQYHRQKPPANRRRHSRHRAEPLAGAAYHSGAFVPLFSLPICFALSSGMKNISIRSSESSATSSGKSDADWKRLNLPALSNAWSETNCATSNSPNRWADGWGNIYDEAITTPSGTLY